MKLTSAASLVLKPPHAAPRSSLLMYTSVWGSWGSPQHNRTPSPSCRDVVMWKQSVQRHCCPHRRSAPRVTPSCSNWLTHSAPHRWLAQLVFPQCCDWLSWGKNAWQAQLLEHSLMKLFLFVYNLVFYGILEFPLPVLFHSYKRWRSDDASLDQLTFS